MKSSAVKTLSPNLFPVVGIGASAGGLDAFKKLIKAIPADSGMAYVFVQHLDPKHESLLPELLQKVTSIPVVEISDEIKVEPNHIYVIPSNKIMVANDGVLQLTARPEKGINVRNLPIDLFFTSLAEVHQANAIGVVLSGTASDGTAGLKAINEYGGITFAQDEASAAYSSMPHNAMLAGVVDFILPPEEIPQKLLEVTNITNGKNNDAENPPPQDEDVFKKIIALLRIRKGTDFTYYKQATIRRRILRRMALNKNNEVLEYLKYLEDNKPEQDVLYQDLLIPVTSFFRDKKTFDHLCKDIFPAIEKSKTASDPLRIWVAGCSTGEEAYSIAICFQEFLAGRQRAVQIFATDISKPAIAKARAGLYSKSSLESVSAEQLSEFFTKSNSGYRVNKAIRDICVFAMHNFLKDPPFGKMDFISCRNVLIYMEPYLQKKVLGTFHFSLNPGGFLLLGKSETTSGVPDLFESVVKNDKLFLRKNAPRNFIQAFSKQHEKELNHHDKGSKKENIGTDFQRTADDIILNKYTPAGVVVNEAMDIVHFRGSTASYLEQSAGKPSHNLLKMAKNGLAFELRNILHKVKNAKIGVIKENVHLQDNGGIRNVSIEAIPLPDMIEPHYLILFHENAFTDNKPVNDVSRKTPSSSARTNEKDLRIQSFETELAQTREDMRSITEDQEASNEELQSANEELLSGSEELQSLNEELETSKEELQSTNEELAVLNQELLTLNEQVVTARNYAESIIATMYQPLLVLDKNLRVKSANKAFYKGFKLNEPKTEDVLIYDLDNGQWNIPELRILLEKILPQKTEIKNYEVTHNFSSVGEKTLLLNALEINRDIKEEKLILLSIEDITDRKKAEEIISKTSERFRMLVKGLPAAVYSCDAHGYINFYNDAAVKVWGREPVMGKERWCGAFKIFNSDGSPISIEDSPAAIAFKERRAIQGKEIMIERPDGSRSVVIVYPQSEFSVTGELTGLINIGFDITEQSDARKQIKESEMRYNNMFMRSPFAFAVLKGKDMVITFANDNIKEIWANTHNVIDRPFFDVFPEMKTGPVPAWLDKVYTTGTPYYGYEYLVSLLRKGKIEDIYLNFVYQPYLEADGTISGVAVLAYEVTTEVNAQKRIEESERRFRLMAEMLPQKVWTADSKGNKNYFNQIWLDYSGLEFLQLKDWGWQKTVHPDDWEKTRSKWQHSIDTGEAYNVENRLLNKDGRYLWHLTRAIPLKDADGKITIWIGIKTEIQEQVEQKQALEKAVRKRTYELQEANEELAFQSMEKEKKTAELTIANKELQAFAYVSSHDLQEPLRKIQTFANLILQKEIKTLSVNGREYFSRMQSAAARMQQLIVDLLAFSHLNTADRKFENRGLNEIIDEVKDDFKEIIETTRAVVETAVLCTANIIPFQFRQLMQNLFSNALKFTTEGIPPHIIIKSKIEKGSKIRRRRNSLLSGYISPEQTYCHIVFSDNGIGFDPQYNELIFEVFQRLHDREEYPGTGIGLAIVKKIVERHDGIITATGRPGRGSIFNIYIPA